MEVSNQLILAWTIAGSLFLMVVILLIYTINLEKDHSIDLRFDRLEDLIKENVCKSNSYIGLEEAKKILDQRNEIAKQFAESIKKQ